jgi:phosphatidylglycerophosphate synthase
VNIDSKKKHFYIPCIVTLLRIVAAFSFLHFFFINSFLGSVLIFSFAIVTDILDGIIARKLGVASTFGAYFDATADCCFIIIVFSAFVIRAMYPFWILILIGIMFLQFILTSRFKQPVYDPVGRYCGVFFFITIGVSLIFPHSTLYFTLIFVIIGFSTASLISRYVSLYNSFKTEGRSL